MTKRLKTKLLLLFLIMAIQSPLLAQSNVVSDQLSTLLFSGNKSSKDIIKQLEGSETKQVAPSIYQTVDEEEAQVLPLTNNVPEAAPKRELPSKIEAMFIEEDSDLFSLRISTKNEELSLQEVLATEDPDLVLSRQLIVENQTLKAQLATQNFTKQFGYDIFQKNSNNLSFAMIDIPIGPDYLLGPGDKLNIYVWGKIEEALEVELDHRGQIYLPSVGKVSLMGARYGDAQKIVKEALAQEFVNFNVSLTIKELKSIRIFVLGDVEKPGAYNITSAATVFHALYAAGGPTKLGSLRSVKLIRKNKAIARVDLYRYLLNGDKNQDFTLMNNDTIFIPPIGDVAKIDGEIKRSAIYELRPGTTIGSLIDYAGGLTATAYTQRLQVKRQAGGQRKAVIDLEFSSISDMSTQLSKTKLQNGDSVKIFPMKSRLRNFVTIEGNIKREGRIEFKPGMNLGDLISKAQGLKEGSYKKRIDIYSYVSDLKREMKTINLEDETSLETPLKEWDIVRIYTIEEVEGEETVYIEGALKDPGEYKLLKNMRVSDLVFTAKFDTFSDKTRAEIFRRKGEEKQTIIPVDLTAALKNPGGPADFKLVDKDQVIVRLDFESYKLRKIILSGEFKYPGVYFAKNGERLSSIIKRAGGFTEKAFLDGSVFTRKSVRKREKSGQARVIEDEKKRLIYDQSHLASVSTELQVASQVVIESRKQSLQSLEEKVQDASGRMVIYMDELEELTGSKSDIEIQDGDALVVPEIPISVQVIGGVGSPTAILYEKGKSTNYYIGKVGGFTQYAIKKETMILKANGSVSKRSGIVGPGDTIYVPEKVKIPFNVLNFLSNLAQILTSIVIIDNLVE